MHVILLMGINMDNAIFGVMPGHYVEQTPEMENSVKIGHEKLLLGH